MPFGLSDGLALILSEILIKPQAILKLHHALWIGRWDSRRQTKRYVVFGKNSFEIEPIWPIKAQ